MKKVKVQYMVGSVMREVELENVRMWESHDDNSMTFSNDDGDPIAEFANVVAVMRVDGK